MVTHSPAASRLPNCDFSANGAGRLQRHGHGRFHGRLGPPPAERLDRAGHFADVFRRGATATAYARRAQVHEPLGVFGQIFRRAEVDPPIIDFLRDARVGLHDQRQGDHADRPLDGAQEAVGPGAAVHPPGDRLRPVAGQRGEQVFDRLAGDRFALAWHHAGKDEGHVGRRSHGRGALLERRPRRLRLEDDEIGPAFPEGGGLFGDHLFDGFFRLPLRGHRADRAGHEARADRRRRPPAGRWSRRRG